MQDAIDSATTVAALGKIADRIDLRLSEGKVTADEVASLTQRIDRRDSELQTATN